MYVVCAGTSLDTRNVGSVKCVDVSEIPTYRPTAAEFEDIIAYVESISAEAQIYGMCRIIPPPDTRKVCQLCHILIQVCSRNMSAFYKVHWPHFTGEVDKSIVFWCEVSLSCCAPKILFFDWVIKRIKIWYVGRRLLQ